MKSPDDHDIKARFRALKREVETRAPTWSASWEVASRSKRPIMVTRTWKVALLTAAAAVVIAAAMFWPTSNRQELVQSLPPLFDGSALEHSRSFLTFVEPVQSSAWPSDSFIPQHINLINP